MICAFTGHRDLEPDFDREKLKESILKLIERGADVFYCGMARGFDLECAECVIDLKKSKEIKLVACIPCTSQAAKFGVTDKEMYDYVLKNCDERKVLSEKYYPRCMLVRNEYMVDNADCVFVYLKRNSGGTYHTFLYAKKQGKKIIFFE